MSERGAENVFVRLRWPQTDGKPICPHCGCQICYDCRRSDHHPRWRCKACRADFSATSGTLFAWHKLPLRTYLMAIAVFCNEVKGKSMLAFCRDIDVQYKTAFVLAHKLREAMASSTKALRIGGEGRSAEVDGAYFGGHIRPENLATERIDRRLAENRSGKRQVVVAMRERGGRTLAQVFAADAVAAIRRRISRAPRCMPMRARPGTCRTPIFRCSGSTTRTAIASTAPAPKAPSPTSRVCVAANSAITTTSPGDTLSATPKRRPGARTCAASATAGRSTA
jgi:transposase-like protein